MIATIRSDLVSSILAFFRSFNRTEFRHHLEQSSERPQLADLFDLIAEIFQREIVAEQFFLHFLGGILIDRLLHLVDQGQDIAHAQNARGNAVGMERLERIGFLAHADKFQRLPGDAANRSAAPPRASPSILVRITPVMPSRLWNSSADLTASWPVMASATNRISIGFRASFSSSTPA